MKHIIYLTITSTGEPRARKTRPSPRVGEFTWKVMVDLPHPPQPKDMDLGTVTAGEHNVIAAELLDAQAAVEAEGVGDGN